MPNTDLLSPWIRRFLLEYLVAERNLARNTQKSYRDTLQQFLPFIARTAHRPIERNEEGCEGLGRCLQGQHETVQIVGTVAAGQVLLNRVVEQGQAHGVPLVKEKIGERGSQGGSVLSLGMGPGPIAHGATVINQ